jgi:hypothetical protein
LLVSSLVNRIRDGYRSGGLGSLANCRSRRKDRLPGCLALPVRLDTWMVTCECVCAWDRCPRTNFRNFPVSAWERRPHLFSKYVGEPSRVSGRGIDLEGDCRLSEEII